VNPFSEFLLRHVVGFHFLTGLAFFVVGVALATCSPRISRLEFGQAARPLAAFGLLHGTHEWVEMFQRITLQTGETSLGVLGELAQTGVLALSFLMLMAFVWWLPALQSVRHARLIRWGILAAPILWLCCALAVALMYSATSENLSALVDALTRYILGIPAALLGAWALLRQQYALRRAGMARLGQDLIWCSAILVVYGLVGQLFVPATSLPSAIWVNSGLFLRWFGIPIELFQAILASLLAIFMIRALNMFETEGRLALEQTLERERQITEEMVRINEALHLKTHDLALLLDLSTRLAASITLEHGLEDVLQKIIQELTFPEAGLISLVREEDRTVYVAAAVGFPADETNGEISLLSRAIVLGELSVQRGLVVCQHLDGVIFEFPPQDAEQRSECRSHQSPLMVVSFPLTVHQQVIGSITLSWSTPTSNTSLSPDEYNLIIGIAQQMALCIENVRLRQQAQEREHVLSDVLRQVVSAQEKERQRTARELHDVMGQSLTGIALGLRGIENMLSSDAALAVRQIRDLKDFSANALNELHQLIADLRPPQLDDLGLAAAVQWYLHEFEMRSGIRTTFSRLGERMERLPPEHEITLFRIVQEALTNVARHAHASRVDVQLKVTATQVSLAVKDDGCGFDVAQVLSLSRNHRMAGRHGWGLLNVQERAGLLGGRCEIISRPGQGCEIRVRVPLPEQSSE